MGKFLTVKYVMAVRDIEAGYDGKLSSAVTGRVRVDRQRVVAMAIEAARKAYAEGVRFGRVESRKPAANPPFPSTVKAKIVRTFDGAVRLAAGVYDLKETARLDALKRNRKDSQREIIFNEYFNSIKRAFGRVCMDAGQAGVTAVARDGGGRR